MEFNSNNAWLSVTMGTPKVAKSTSIIDPNLRHIYRWKAYTICARGDSFGIVQKTEVFFMHCMQKNIKVALGRFLASHLQSITTQPNENILIRSLVTKIATYLKVFDPKDITFKLLPQSDAEVLNLHTLVKMELIKKHDLNDEDFRQGEDIAHKRSNPSSAPMNEGPTLNL
ncbi:conserved hypothetical protein [Ricinus communis]|uniref:Uncharacterized protein n=1 Tax=Ricinus communis TaxID=3988 RepID=B9SM33_RICCO|nr:conserved hypothetical protein [Ricinus communis]